MMKNLLIIAVFSWFPPLDNHPGWILSIAAGLTGMITLPIFKLMTDQKAVKRINGNIIGRALELLLYRHDPTIQLKAVVGMIRGIGAAAGRILPGALLATVPVVLILFALESFFDARPLQPGESAIFKAYLSPGLSAIDQTMTLKGSENIAIETLALCIPSANEMNWRFRVMAASPSPAWLELAVNGRLIRREVSIGKSCLFDDAGRHCGGVLEKVFGKLSPSDKAIYATLIAYPPRPFILAGIHVNWLFAYFTLLFVITGFFKRLIG